MTKRSRVDVKRIRVENFIRKHDAFLNKTQIQKELNLPKDALIRFLRYGRKLTDEDINKMDSFIQEMLFTYEDDKMELL